MQGNCMKCFPALHAGFLPIRDLMPTVGQKPEARPGSASLQKIRNKWKVVKVKRKNFYVKKNSAISLIFKPILTISFRGEGIYDGKYPKQPDA